MRRGVLALMALMIVGSAANADYIFLQYVMKEKRQGAGSGSGGGGQPATPPAQPGGAQQPGGGQQDQDVITYAVNTVVELNGELKQIPDFRSNKLKAVVKHKYGATSLFNDNEQLIARYIKYPSVHSQYIGKRDALAQNHTNDKVFAFAEWCLSRGLIKEFEVLFDDLAKAGKKTGTDHLDKAVEAFTQAKAALGHPLDRDDYANYWRGRLGFRMTPSDHYALLYNASLDNPPEVERRLKLLEDNMKAVYYWFAMRGKVLAAPEQKMVAVLLNQADQFLLQRALIEDEPLVSDGFFSARDNVVVFSTQRLDLPSIIFSNVMKGLYAKGWDQGDLLKEKKTGKQPTANPDEFFRMQTLALLDKSLEEEGERAAVSQEGTRQIFVSCGLQKATVVMPDWIQFGMASVLETPKGPYPAAPVELRAPYWYGYGGPSWKYARIFKILMQADEQAAQASTANNFMAQFRFSKIEFSKAGATLRQVVTDSDFTHARDLGPRADRALLEARTRAWSLCYFLLRTRTEGVFRLYREFETLPRDLEPEPRDLLGCFCRAFDVADTTGTKMDPAKFENLAQEWLGYMKTVPTPGAEFKLDVNPNTGQPGSGQPGGTGGPPPHP